VDNEEYLISRLSPGDLVAYRVLLRELFSESSRQDSDNDVLCPGLFECSSGRAAGGAGGEYVINEQNGAAIQTGISPDSKGMPHSVRPVRGGLLCQAIGSLDPSKGLPDSKAKRMGQASGQSFSLVVTTLQLPPPVQGNRDNPGVAREPGEFALPRGGK
jgi:hypothetical protein